MVRNTNPSAAALQARRALASLPAGEAGGRARASLGLALRALGDEAEAARELEAAALVVGGDLRRALLGEAGSGRAGLVPAPPPASAAVDPVAAAEPLVAAARHREALAALAAADAAALPPLRRARAGALRALALLGLGQRPDAAAEARKVLAIRSDAGTRDAAELVLARVAARDGRHAEAIAHYRRIAARRGPVPGLAEQAQRDLRDDASFLAAWLPYDAGRFAEASRSLTAWLGAHPGSRRADDARWFAAWSYVRMGNRDKAREALGRLTSGTHAPAALYWQARLVDGPAAQGRLLRRARAAGGPESWYGQLAASRLAALGLPVEPWRVAPGNPPGDGPGPGAAGARLGRAAALLGAGLDVAGRAALAEAARSPGGSAARVAQLAEALGNAELAARMARDHLAVTRRSLAWGHPRAFGEPLQLVAAAAGVDPFLLLAVARRESGFRAEVRSAAGAEGPFQLLPATEERLAALAGLARPGHLSEPSRAVASAGLYLGLLTDRFAHPAAAVAAYNAGPAAAATWGRGLAGLPLDEWVEDLPFRETRRYVKAVLADAGVYRWLYEGGDLRIDGLVLVPAPGAGAAF
ncbi:MAG: transglycosylase SLT domain-containing protein [Deltaproteobacteria bacterium]|nr:transglycosylase SLT domain-containing protein [Deltaproteobacteria bacterium]